MKKIDVKVPSVLNDLYRDLRDRHLLIPALGLIVALAAVPMVLGKENKPAPPPPPPTIATEAAATSPAVLADTEVSVRDYRKRLEALKSKNPFDQQFVIPPQALTDPSATGTVPTDTSGGLPPSATNAGGAVGTTSLPDPPAGGTTDNTSGDSDDGDTEVVTELYVRRVDVMVGIQGDLERRNSVKPMTVLPSNNEPVLAYLGTDEKGKRAAFVVSSDVSSVGGDGACVPSPGCLFITLEKGETATLDYQPNGQTYELQLRGIRNVKVKAD